MRARAVPRWLWLAHGLYKGTAPERGLSLSARGRGATCQPWQPTRSRLWRGTRARATEVAASREEAQHARVLGARRVALVVVGPRSFKAHWAGDRPLSFGTCPQCNVIGAASNAQPALAWRAHARQCAGCPSGSGAAGVLAARARRA